MLPVFTTIMRTREVLLATLWDEVRRKYAGSAFGMFWLLLLPLMFLGFYSIVYLTIFKVKPVDMAPADYVLFIYVGLMPFLSFSESISSGAGALASNRAVLLNTVFPAELIPLRTVLAAQTTFLVGISVAVLWAGIEGRLSPWIALLPLYIIAQIMFLTGLAWILAPIYLVFRDLGQILNFVVLGLMVISPIAYRASSLSPQVRALVDYNPLYYFLVGYQSIIFDGVAPPFNTAAIMLAGSMAMFMLGHWFCRRVKTIVADYA